MLLPVRTRAIAALTALSLMASLPAAPALAWGKNERNFVAGVATAVVVGAIINDINKKQRARRAAPQYVYPAQPVYQPQPVYNRPPVYSPAPGYSSIYSTPAARAFQSYSPAERKAIQRRLATQGYYRSGIDGSFGPGTYSAVLAYARDTRVAENLQSTAGAYAVYDGLLF
jgi:peptidoglycan hydrolase-like protein with peptidoglycan-binding domain